ncbi:NACHT, LRR and PYD domains-containing protein 3-like isoform X2 [Tachypleus tridentatus]
MQLAWTTPLPWCQEFRLPLEEYYTTLSLIPVSSQGEKQFQTPITLESLFIGKGSDERVPAKVTRVIVEADAGYGKTTFTQKVAYDWATKKCQYMEGFDMVFLIPLKNVFGTFKEYVLQELLPKDILHDNLHGNTIWKHLVAQQKKLLFILDGYDELAQSRIALLRDFLQGRELPWCTILITTRPKKADELLPYFERKIVIVGFSKNQVRPFVQRYFHIVNQPLYGDVLLHLIFSQASQKLRTLSSCPLLLLLLCVLFEESGDSVPTTSTVLYKSLFQILIQRYIIRHQLSDTENILVILEDTLKKFGNVCLNALKEDRLHFSHSEIKKHCSEHIFHIGILVKYNTGKKACREDFFQAIHKTILEYLSALYLCSLAETSHKQCLKEYATLFKNSDVFSMQEVTLFLTGLLKNNAHFVIEAIPMSLKSNLHFMLDVLSESGTSSNNVQIVAKSTGVKLIVHSSDSRLAELTAVLQHEHCFVREVEFRWTPVHSTNDFLLRQQLFEVLNKNATISQLSISTLLGHFFTKEEVEALAKVIRICLSNSNLEGFTLCVPLFRENVEDGKFQPIVTAVCSGLMSNCSLRTFHFDMEMTSNQICEVCYAIEKSSSLFTLNLPHLCCTTKGFEALGNVLRKGIVKNLNLDGTWSNARSDNSEWLEKSSFFSFITHSCRPEENPIDFNTVFPSCEKEKHQDFGFHHIFQALKDVGCQLQKLDLGICELQMIDSLCLSEAVRYCSTLVSLNLKSVTRVGSVIPVFLALETTKSLQKLNLSGGLSVSDAHLQVIFQSIKDNVSLRSLNLKGWKFNVSSKETLKMFIDIVRVSKLEKINLEGCFISCSIEDFSWFELSAFRKSSLKHLLISRIKVKLKSSSNVLSYGYFFPVLKAFPSLLELNMSSTNHENSLLLATFNDAQSKEFFQFLGTMKTLKFIKICHWRFLWSTPEDTLKYAKKCIVSSSLEEINISNCHIENCHNRNEIKHEFIISLLKNAKQIKYLALNGCKLTISQMLCIARHIQSQMKNKELSIKVFGVPDISVHTLVNTLSNCGYFDIDLTVGYVVIKPKSKPKYNFFKQFLGT